MACPVVHFHMFENGWTFQDGPGVVADPIHNARFMYEIYLAAQSDFTGRVTVPVIWDKEQNTIVNNESSEIIRMFNREFNSLDGVDADLDFYPAALRTEIDEINAVVYDTVNNGVYRAGFATTQPAYDKAVAEVFETLGRTRSPPRAAAIPGRVAAHRSRLAPLYHAGALRYGVPLPLQVQCSADCGLFKPVGLRCASSIKSQASRRP